MLKPSSKVGHIGAVQTVIAMLPLHQDGDQVRRLQPIQVRARGRRTHFGHHCELGAGTGTAIHQAVENAGSRRLADSCCNSRGYLVMLNIHSSLTNELSMSDSQHTTNHAARKAQADESARSDGGPRRDGYGSHLFLRYARGAGDEEEIHGYYLRHPLPDRSLPAGRF